MQIHYNRPAAGKDGWKYLSRFMILFFASLQIQGQLAEVVSVF